jgi:hypothetical protein
MFEHGSYQAKVSAEPMLSGTGWKPRHRQWQDEEKL